MPGHSDGGARISPGHVMADGFQRTVVSQKELAGLDPAHAGYAYTQNQELIVSEQLTALKEMAPFADLVSRAEDLYMPSAPPMSLLTRSYFTCRAFRCLCGTGERDHRHHHCVGHRSLWHASWTFAFDPADAGVANGLLHPPGREGNVSILEDLVTSAVYRAIVPAGYSGRKNENWYVRLLPRDSTEFSARRKTVMGRKTVFRFRKGAARCFSGRRNCLG